MVLFFIAGCRKQISVIPERPPQTEIAPKKVNPFENVDTSGNAVFTDASLSDDLSRQAAEALKTIYFDYNSFQLNTDAADRLQIIAAFLKSNQGLRILVIGHCDERGASEYNIGLGEKRARAAKEYLINIGIEQIRLETTSYGKEQPAQGNCIDEICHSKNRRDEFRVLAK